ncbi:MAG: hypothetical protein IH940_01425 [Acidobacteria bacterium]|nr:hypothetical protein [Acidobacteriota bacterium]
MTSRQYRLKVNLALAACAVVLAIFNPMVTVFAVILAANLTLGQREDVPFSTYGMFSSPSNRSWALSFEDSKGELFPIATFGLLPSTVRKSFSADLGGLGDEVDPTEHARRRRAVAGLVEMVEKKRPSFGEWASEPITIIYLGYQLKGGKLVTDRDVLAVTEPQ